MSHAAVRMAAVPRFASKSAPSAAKLRGGYYTPEPVARYIARWVAKAGPRILEPSCGNGAVLRFLSEECGASQVFGIEIDQREAQEAARSSGAAVLSGDFFDWFSDDEHGAWDGVAGNPPYIRFGNWPESARAVAMKLMADSGLRPSRLTNAFVPFVVASVLALRSAGRLALVVPAELLQVGYAGQLRKFLAEHLSEIRLVSFQNLLFEGVLQEVVLLLGIRGNGPAEIKTESVDDVARLERLTWSDSAVAMSLLDHEKWTKYYLLPREIEALRVAETHHGVSRLGEFAGVDVGVVTGRNSFFTMTPSEAQERGLDQWCRPLVARSAQLKGSTFTDLDLVQQQSDDVRSLLLVVDRDCQPDEQLQSYIQLGESEGIHQGYKCSIRKQWWSVPSVWVPDAFMLRQLHTHPRIVANKTEATSTDTVHRVSMRAGSDVTSLATAAINSLTFAHAEVIGRSYGGGILELEPREAEDLLIPDPSSVPPLLCEEIDSLLRHGHLDEARRTVDREVLVGRLGFTETEVGTFAAAWERMRARRASRGRSGRARTGVV
jgi:adenine-specific DNA methylase